MSNEVRLQNLRGFTVQICKPATSEIVGTGIVVSSSGWILTCAHVIRTAGVEPRNLGRGQVVVHLPQSGPNEEKARLASIIAYFPQHDDDVVLLEIDQPLPFGNEQIAVLGPALGSEGNSFRSYGYAPLGNRIARYVNGKIMGQVEVESSLKEKLQADPIELRTRDIRPGISGAAVLDETRNLVVGLITERWNPAGKPEDDNLGWATDATVLTFDPFNFLLRQEDLPLREAPRVEFEISRTRVTVGIVPNVSWNFAPSPIQEWVGREELLAALQRDWLDPDRLVTGIIGTGGIGKSSLARRWVDKLLGDNLRKDVPRIFWWSFSERNQVSQFFEAAVSFLSQGLSDPPQYQSVAACAQLLAGMSSENHFLFVLDGIDALQYQEGDRYGLLVSDEMRDFLLRFAGQTHRSYCLITSRFPILDLVGFTTYVQRDVPAFTHSEDIDLLRQLGIESPMHYLERIANAFGGHPLALKLIASDLKSKSATQFLDVDEAGIAISGKSPGESVTNILLRYDELLSDNERTVLMFFSAFREPTPEAALQFMLRTKVGRSALSFHVGQPSHHDIHLAIERLLAYSLLTHDLDSHTYAMHPLVQEYYSKQRIELSMTQEHMIHEGIKQYYLSVSSELPFRPRLDDLRTLIEAVHHACCAEFYDEAFEILVDRIYQQKRRLLVNELGAWEIALSLLFGFFPGGDTSNEPQVTDSQHKVWVRNETGLSLQILGRLNEAAEIYKHAIPAATKTGNWRGATASSYNLAQLYVFKGDLVSSDDAASEAVVIANRSADKRSIWVSLACKAWICSLRGRSEEATAIFREAEAIRGEVQPSRRYLTGLAGIWHADHLRRIGMVREALVITKANRMISTRYKWLNHLSQCHRVLGDLRYAEALFSAAGIHYDKAIRIARMISNTAVLIEALLARGIWQVGVMKDTKAAQRELDEGLELALRGGFRIYETDIRIGLARTHLASGETDASTVEAELANRMSAQMGYHWGQVNATMVLSKRK